jgi:hypothetical protein
MIDLGPVGFEILVASEVLDRRTLRTDGDAYG